MSSARRSNSRSRFPRIAAVEDRRGRGRVELAQRVDEQRERPNRFGFVRRRLEHDGARFAGESGGRIEQAALADAGLAEQQHGAAAALLDRRRDRGAKALELGVAADEPRLAGALGAARATLRDGGQRPVAARGAATAARRGRCGSGVRPAAPRQARNSSPVGVAPASFSRREPI